MGYQKQVNELVYQIGFVYTRLTMARNKTKLKNSENKQKINLKHVPMFVYSVFRWENKY